MMKAIINPDQDAVVCEVEINAPPHLVFRALTSADQLMRWWTGEGGPCQVKRWEMDGRLGGKWKCVVFDPTGEMVVHGVSEFESFGEIVEFEPPRVLSYTWSATFHSIPTHQSLVRWELSVLAQGTLVKITHSALKDLPGGTGYVNGWPSVIQQLKQFAEGEGI